jgi:hypothetical protein
MAVMNWVERQKVRFSQSFVAALLAAFPTFSMLVLAPPLFTSLGFPTLSGVVSSLVLFLGVIIQAGAIRWRFQLAFKRACLVSLIVFGIGSTIGWLATQIALHVLPKAPG